MGQNAANFETQSGSAKSALVGQIARLVRKAGLDYEGWRYVSKRVRQACELRPAKKGRKLSRVLNADDFRKFYEAVDKADDAQHALMMRLLCYTGVRVSELCNALVAEVDPEACKIRINQGKGAKDRYVLFGRSFGTALRTHIAAHGTYRYLFQTRRNSKYTPRRVQQIVKLYAEKAGVVCTPHTFRHQAITWLTRHSGLVDAELQLITGHAPRETLAVYQHVALDGDQDPRPRLAQDDGNLHPGVDQEAGRGTLGHAPGEADQRPGESVGSRMTFARSLAGLRPVRAGNASGETGKFFGKPRRGKISRGRATPGRSLNANAGKRRRKAEFREERRLPHLLHRLRRVGLQRLGTQCHVRPGWQADQSPCRDDPG